FAEFGARFECAALHRRGWIVALLWTSETPSLEAVKEATVTAVFRAAWCGRHGPARTLRERMAQEGFAMARAGCGGPRLDGEDLEYTRGVLEPFLDSRDTG